MQVLCDQMWWKLDLLKLCEDSKIVKYWSVHGFSLMKVVNRDGDYCGHKLYNPWKDGSFNDGLSLTGPTKTLFVKGLSEDTTDQTLKDAFDSAVAARIVTDRDTGSSKG